MRPCWHGVDGGCPYCRALVIADQGPDPDDRLHDDPAAHPCGCCP